MVIQWHRMRLFTTPSLTGPRFTLVAGCYLHLGVICVCIGVIRRKTRRAQDRSRSQLKRPTARPHLLRNHGLHTDQGGLPRRSLSQRFLGCRDSDELLLLITPGEDVFCSGHCACFRVHSATDTLLLFPGRGCLLRIALADGAYA